MSHNINAYIGRQAAWHKLGTVTGKYQTTEELLSDPAFAYDVFKSQLRDGLGRPVNAWGTFRWNHVDKPHAPEASVFLGPVGENYTVIHHRRGFDLIDGLMKGAPKAHYETAGVLGQGEKVWALADLGLGFTVGESDQHNSYLLFATGHDGSLSAVTKMTTTRVVCQNTLNIALSEKSATFRVRHTSGANARIDAAENLLGSIRMENLKMSDRLNWLASRKVTRESMEQVLNRLFPVADGKKSSKQRDTLVDSVLALYEINDNNAFPEQRGTAFNLLNAITNHVDHSKSTPESAMFGSGDTLKTLALRTITDASSLMTSI